MRRSTCMITAFNRARIRTISSSRVAEFTCIDSIKPDEWDFIIDVRSPTEFAEDHVLAGNVLNLPVLSDAERCAVGTLHATDSFEARKLGASFVSQNIASILRNLTLTRQQHVLVYEAR